MCTECFMPRLAQTDLLTLCLPCTPYCAVFQRGRESIGSAALITWERDYDGKQSIHWSWSCCRMSAAHITDNLLRSARSFRNKVLPTPLPCWHPSFRFPSACRFPGHQLCSQLLVLFTYHPGPGTSFLRSCPLMQTLRAGRFPFQNTAP